MPIDTDSFEEGRPTDSVERDVRQFLYDDPETAYTAQEIAHEVIDGGLSGFDRDEGLEVGAVPLTDVVNLSMVTTILDRLVDDGRVVRRLVETRRGEQCYYRAPSVVDGA